MPSGLGAGARLRRRG